VLTVATNVRNYLVFAKQPQHAAVHAKRNRVMASSSSLRTPTRYAYLSAINGVSDVAYPTVEAFCRALQLKGEAWSRVSAQDLQDKEIAIDLSLGAAFVRSGDLVEVFRDTKTACNGELRRFGESVTLVRDERSGVSGWVLSQELSSALDS
jgi:hypothetical protein